VVALRLPAIPVDGIWFDNNNDPFVREIDVGIGHV